MECLAAIKAVIPHEESWDSGMAACALIDKRNVEAKGTKPSAAGTMIKNNKGKGLSLQRRKVIQMIGIK